MQNISYGEFNKINSINFTSEYGKLKNIKLEGSTTQSTRSGKNIFNKKAKIIENGVTKSVLDTGVRITQTHAGKYRYGGIRLGGSELLGKTLRISANWTKSADNVPYIAIYLGNSSSMALYSLFGTGVSGQIIQITIPNAFPAVGEQVCDTVYILLYSNRDGTGNVGDYVDYTDLIVTVDNDDMTYEDYGVSPSPDYPSQIENVEGRNKFNYLWFDTTKEVDWTAYQSISSIAKAIPIFIGKGNVATFSSNVPLLSGNNLLYAINDLTQTSSASFALGKTQTIKANNEGYVYVGYIKSRTNYDKVKDGTYYVQVEEGTVANPYVLYNSLEIKDVGENLFNISKVQNVKEDVANCTLIEKNANGVKIQGATSTATDIFALSKGWYCPSYSKASEEAQVSIKEPCTIKLSADVTLLETVTEPRIRMSLRKANGDAILADSTVLNLNKKTRIETTFKVNPGKFSPFFALCSNTFLIENIMISTTGGEYKPYQEQKVDFPLSEGQKLYEGSYLADDGIHHKRKQYVITGQENWFLGVQYTPQYGTRFDCNVTTYPMAGRTNAVVCSHYKYVGNNAGGCWVNYVGGGNYLQLRIQDNFSTVDELKTYLQKQYSNGTPVIVEYELLEEEIVPYTTEQQEAWDKIENFPIFIGQNNLTSTALLSAIYIKKITTDTKVDYNLYNEDYIKIATKNNIHPKFKIQMLDEYENVIDEITGDISRDNSGSISNNYQQGVRRSVSLTFIDTEGKFLPDSNSNLIWANKKFKLFSGLLDTDTNEIFWFSEGIYYFSNVSSSRNGADKLTTVNGVDKFGKFGSELGYNQLESTYLIPAGTKIYDAIKGILNIDIGNGYPIDPIEPVLDPLYIDEVCPYDISKSPSSYLSEMLIELADIIGCDIYYDADGRLHVDSGTIDSSYSNKPSIWDFSDVLPEYMNPSITTNFAEFINTVKVVGNNTNDKTYEYTAVNNNPESPTRVDLIGTKSTYIESASVYNTDRAKDYAEYKLNMFSILQLAVTFSCTFLPHLDVNKVITITDSYYKYEKQRFVIQSITLPLSYDGVMSISACNVASLPYYEGGN